MSDTLSHVFVNFSKRKITLLDEEGYEKDVCWKITRPDGKSVMMVPVNEVSPIPDEIQTQVDEFQKQFMETNET
ncbi:hypothetical protein Syn7803US62_18 [Synechococcus phage ACG-2014a]|uniref:Uncharacterized protein n=1 Tax=Synechococcus phage ACG-2014a TaxID=1493507 RepID=A0A0E3FUX8_9CAUD|nr:hypothetical protein Syn7803US62_18 [Synechococcus phage ACG-2014a]